MRKVVSEQGRRQRRARGGKRQKEPGEESWKRAEEDGRVWEEDGIIILKEKGKCGRERNGEMTKEGAR